MNDPEAKRLGSDGKERGTSREVGAGDGEDKDGLKFLEQLMLFMKLRLLKKATKIEGVDSGVIAELEKDIQDKKPEKQKDALSKINVLLSKIVNIEEDRANVSLGELVARVPEGKGPMADVAGNLEMRAESLLKGEYAGDKHEEAKKIVKGLVEVGLGLNVLKAGEERTGIAEKLNTEIAEINEFGRKLEMAKAMDELKPEKMGKTRIDQARSKSLKFVNEELEDKPTKATKVKLKAGKDPERRALQVEVDSLLEKIQEEIATPRELERLDANACLERILQINKLERQRGKMQDPGKVTDNFFELQVVYQEQLEKILERDKFANKGQIYEVVKQIWTSKKLPTAEELSAKLNKALEDGGSSVTEDDDFDWRDDPARAINQRLGVSHARNKRPIGHIEKVLEILRDKNLNVVTITQQFRGRTEAEFARTMIDKYGFSRDEASLLYGSINYDRSQFKNLEFNEHLKHDNYKGYTESLISYLYTVGLREGMNDMALLQLMNEARYNLAEAGRDDLLDTFKAFENMAFFHDKYFNLGAKEYGEILNHLGNGPLWVWLQKHADVLKNDVEFKNGLRNGEKATVSVLEMHDMMQSQHWAKKLTYTAPIDETDLYKEMMASHLLNSDEPVKIMPNGEIKNMDDRVIGNTNDMVQVDGVEKKLSVFLNDSLWKVGTAQDIWRFTGRNLNILDDIDIGKALGANKGLLGITKICRYSEQYEFISSYQHDIMGADTFLYDFDWYKNTLGKGMTKLFKEGLGGEDAVNNDPAKKKLIEDATAIFSKHAMSRRQVGEEEFVGSNLPIEELRLIGRGTAKMSFEQARDQYIVMQKRLGNRIDPSTIVESDSDKPGYAMQVKLNMEKWNENMLSEEEMATLNSLPWAEINRIYAKRLGKENIGNDFASFMKNFSYARSSEYIDNLRGTDMKDYGGYYNTAAEAVAGAVKAGLANGSSEAIAKMIGAMETYHPYDANGLNRLGLGMWREVLKWRTWAPTRRVPVKSGGYRLPNGELIVNKFGRWEKEMKTEVFLLGDSLMKRYKYLPTWHVQDVEFSMRYLVGKGVFTRADGDAELKRRIGNPVTRFLIRALLLNDWEYFWEAESKERAKFVGDAFKYIFSTK